MANDIHGLKTWRDSWDRSPTGPWLFQASLAPDIWKDEPLVSYETIINLISTTTTKTGLRVRAKLDPRLYQSGLAISDDDMKRLRLRPHRFHPQWNYTIASR